MLHLNPKSVDEYWVIFQSFRTYILVFRPQNLWEIFQGRGFSIHQRKACRIKISPQVFWDVLPGRVIADPLQAMIEEPVEVPTRPVIVRNIFATAIEMVKLIGCALHGSLQFAIPGFLERSIPKHFSKCGNPGITRVQGVG